MTFREHFFYDTMNTDILRNQRILILEDEPATCRLFEAFFKGVCTVDIVTGPEEALERAENDVYHLAIFDIHLKHEILDGPAVLEHVRAIDGYEETPIIASTAHAMPGDEERFLEAGFDEYVAKPFTRDKLLAPIVQLLERSSDG